MKVLFLDIDGVVNCSSTSERFNGFIGIEKGKMAIVQSIVDKTGCKVVLSSSWRLPPSEMLQHVKSHIELIDVTPDNSGLTDRGCEILQWLRVRDDISVYAILDDNSDFHKDQPLFKTDWSTGITQEIADSVIAHLNGVA